MLIDWPMDRNQQKIKHYDQCLRNRLPIHSGLGHVWGMTKLFIQTAQTRSFHQPHFEQWKGYLELWNVQQLFFVVLKRNIINSLLTVLRKCCLLFFTVNKVICYKVIPYNHTINDINVRKHNIPRFGLHSLVSLSFVFATAYNNQYNNSYYGNQTQGHCNARDSTCFVVRVWIRTSTVGSFGIWFLWKKMSWLHFTFFQN